MTTYFTAPDGHGEETLWMRTESPDFPRPVLSRSKLDQPHHWDELVARVIAGNPDCHETAGRHVHWFRRAQGNEFRCSCGDAVWESQPF